MERAALQAQLFLLALVSRQLSLSTPLAAMSRLHQSSALLLAPVSRAASLRLPSAALLIATEQALQALSPSDLQVPAFRLQSSPARPLSSVPLVLASQAALSHLP